MRRPLLDLATLAALAGAVLIAAALIGISADFDLRNYHIYNGYALLNGRLGIDLAPAQLQTFYAPTLDAAYWLLLRALNNTPRLLNVSLALPHALAVCLSWAISRCFLSRLQALVAVCISATGAAMLSTLASAMSEAPTACLILAALWLILRRPDQSLTAGLLAGIAVGLKLTAAPYAIGLIAAAGAKRLPSVATGIALGAALAGGWWWFILWRHFGNPVFPYFNDLFQSPWAAPTRIADLRFMPHGLLQTLLYPFFWAFRPVALVSELPLRDPRIALALVAIPLASWRVLPGPLRPGPLRHCEAPRFGPAEAGRAEAISSPTGCLIVFFLTSITLWEAQFSVYRYLATLELLSGTLIVLACRRFAPLIALAVIAATICPDWGRMPFGPRAVSVAFPALPPDSLVLLLDPAPMAYVAAFAPSGLRFIGADNILIHPGDHNRLAAEIANKIGTHPGALWGLEMPGIAPGVADAALHSYRLARGPGCQHIQSNLDANGILACPLRRQP